MTLTIVQLISTVTKNQYCNVVSLWQGSQASLGTKKKRIRFDSQKSLKAYALISVRQISTRPIAEPASGTGFEVPVYHSSKPSLLA